MKTQSRLRITFGEKNGFSTASDLCIKSKQLKLGVEELGFAFDTYGLGEDSYYSCLIQEPEGSEKLEALISLLKESGFQQCYASILPVELMENNFVMKYERKFVKKDLDKAEYLGLNAKGLQRIADWKRDNQ